MVISNAMASAIIRIKIKFNETNSDLQHTGKWRECKSMKVSYKILKIKNLKEKLLYINCVTA